jgi:hypothetical protein
LVNQNVNPSPAPEFHRTAARNRSAGLLSWAF